VGVPWPLSQRFWHATVLRVDTIPRIVAISHWLTSRAPTCAICLKLRGLARRAANRECRFMGISPFPESDRVSCPGTAPEHPKTSCCLCMTARKIRQEKLSKMRVCPATGQALCELHGVAPRGPSPSSSSLRLTDDLVAACHQMRIVPGKVSRPPVFAFYLAGFLRVRLALLLGPARVNRSQRFIHPPWARCPSEKRKEQGDRYPRRPRMHPCLTTTPAVSSFMEGKINALWGIFATL